MTLEGGGEEDVLLEENARKRGVVQVYAAGGFRYAAQRLLRSASRWLCGTCLGPGGSGKSPFAGSVGLALALPTTFLDHRPSYLATEDTASTVARYMREELERVARSSCNEDGEEGRMPHLSVDVENLLLQVEREFSIGAGGVHVIRFPPRALLHPPGTPSPFPDPGADAHILDKANTTYIYFSFVLHGKTQTYAIMRENVKTYFASSIFNQTHEEYVQFIANDDETEEIYGRVDRPFAWPSELKTDMSMAILHIIIFMINWRVLLVPSTTQARQPTTLDDVFAALRAPTRPTNRFRRSTRERAAEGFRRLLFSEMFEYALNIYDLLGPQDAYEDGDGEVHMSDDARIPSVYPMVCEMVINP